MWRQGIARLGLVACCLLLAACGTKSAVPATTPTPNIIALNGNDTSAEATSACAASWQHPIYKLSDALYVRAGYGLSYPSFALAGTLPAAPWVMPGAPGSAQLLHALGDTPDANPTITSTGGILLSVCNAGTQPLRLSSAQVIVADFKPTSTAISMWNECDGVFVRPGGVTAYGCGGAIVADETLSAAFTPTAGKFATAQATQVSASGMNGYGSLPVTLKPKATISVLISVTRPVAMGTYSFAVAIRTGAAGGASVLSPYAPLPPWLFAPVTHKFTGYACEKPEMQAQIPAQPTTPATYYICPES